MPINFDIKNANHLVNSQLAATTLNDEINNVIKFYRAMITYLSPLYSSETVNITDGIGQNTLNGIIATSLNQINNLTANRGIQIVNKAIGHTNQISQSSTTTAGLLSNKSSAYNQTVNVPYIIIDNHGHVTEMKNNYFRIPSQSLAYSLIYLADKTIPEYYTNIILSENISYNQFYEINGRVFGSNSISFNIVVTGVELFQATSSYPLCINAPGVNIYLYADYTEKKKIYFKKSSDVRSVSVMQVNTFILV